MDFQSCVPVPVDAAAAVAVLNIVGVPLLVVVLPLLLHLLHPSLLVVHHEGVDSEHLVEDILQLLTIVTEEKLMIEACYLYTGSNGPSP